jgi:hypothetical protein
VLSGMLRFFLANNPPLFSSKKRIHGVLLFFNISVA